MRQELEAVDAALVFRNDVIYSVVFVVAVVVVLLWLLLFYCGSCCFIVVVGVSLWWFCCCDHRSSGISFVMRVFCCDGDVFVVMVVFLL